MRARPMTEMYLAMVERAVASPGRWLDVQRTFKTEFNARITGDCLAGGFLRVEPREGDHPITVQGKSYIKTAAPVEYRVVGAAHDWRLAIRYR